MLFGIFNWFEWSAHVVHASNEAHLRILAINQMAGDDYRKDIISGDANGYLLTGT